ncbi:DUF4139 domain-containing protein [Sphingomonas glacialis]|uniref:DUF4139 domain-containing protein n=1 Tax=Sphingomonas glacialis TaxID=658225 RepID=UPI001673E179|nr:hypothetical protein [Sphingomonas glacialis]
MARPRPRQWHGERDRDFRHAVLSPVRRALRWLSVLLVAVVARAAPAQTVSPAPDRVAVTIYRAPDRSADSPIDLSWLGGYALITEQRRVAIPAGRTTLRFEGVAAGILPESAIVTGLPNGVREKNLDAELLSPRSLYAGTFGRPVTLRRTIAKRSVEEPAIIRSSPDGAAIVQTRDGVVAVDCGPATETLVYNGIAPGLSSKPTLSVALDSPRAATVTITLSYLAWGFDWQANYVATLKPDGRSADLLAWVTLASGDSTSFADAETMVVAGRVKREDRAPYPYARGSAPLTFHCFAHPIADLVPGAPPPPPPAETMDIVVTGMAMRAPRRVTQEDLGDLKLYRVPDRTTVAALAQKQVALLDRHAVPVDILYVATVDAAGEAGAPHLTLRALNRSAKGLGVPLPAGPVAVFQPRGDAAVLIGEGAIDDKAVGELVEANLAVATQVTLETTPRESGANRGKAWEDVALTLRNANPHPVRFELQFDPRIAPRVSHPTSALTHTDGKLVWALELPANATRELGYRVSADR